MLTAIGVLILLPESVTNWDLNEMSNEPLTDKWIENVTTKPVMDEDSFVINYIGHPVSGAVYYAMARNDGLNEFESFLFSAAISTFFWEYGYEAFAETPSIQDLFSTPIIGSFMGEYMHYLEIQLDKKEGLIFDSKILGNVSYFFLDPMGNIADGIGETLNLNVTMSFHSFNNSYSQAQTDYDNFINKPVQFQNFDYGFILDFKY